MAKPLSIDLRERIVRACLRDGETIRGAAKRFDVSRATVEGLLKRYRETGSVEPKPHSGGNPTQRLFEVHYQALERYLGEQPDLTNPELVERLVEEFGEQVRVDPSQISRHLNRLGLTRKKKVLYDPKVDTPEVQGKRAAWRRMLKILCLGALGQLVFLDETFVRTHMDRTHGRARRGRRVVGRLRHRAKRYTLVGAMGLSGMIGQWLIGRGMSQEDFEIYVKTVLIPALPARSYVVWDNLKAHYSTAVARQMSAAGHTFLFQSPYSPDFNPIEKAWSKLKTLVRGRKPRGAADLRAAVAWAWGRITPKDIWGFFSHAIPHHFDGDQLVLV